MKCQAYELELRVCFIERKGRSSMQAINYVYDMLVLSTYIITITLLIIVYITKRHKNCAIVAGIFSVFVLDHFVITMTEMVSWFSRAYEKIFLTVPSLKTLVYAISFVLMIQLLQHSAPQAPIRRLWALLVLIITVMLFIPILPDSALKSWLYFLPAQIFLFYYARCGLIVTKDIEAGIEHWEIPMVRTIFKVMYIFAVIIVLEDTFVIFRLDSYTNVVHIVNRSFSEDIMRMLIAVLSIRTILYYFLQMSREEEKQNREMILPDISETPEMPEMEQTVMSAEALTENIEDENTIEIKKEDQGEKLAESEENQKLEAFKQEFLLTERESEIFALILNNMTNQEISDHLMVSLGTVKTHTHNIFSKLEVSRRRDAMAIYEDYWEE